MEVGKRGKIMSGVGWMRGKERGLIFFFFDSFSPEEVKKRSRSPIE